ncbi:MAG: hypothetical protein J7495_01315 [Sphingomonas sp.]|nr:hypothetical protein [Sphingomonas sp.]
MSETTARITVESPVAKPPVLPPTPPPRGPATGSDFFAGLAAIYAVPPNVGACDSGRLKPEVTARVLWIINDIRAHHDLPPVTYAAEDEGGVMAASLMSAANAQMSHTPPPNWTCFTKAGADASANSDLFVGIGGGLAYVSNDDIVIGWLTDIYNRTANSVGHRRWLLFPFLNSVAYGRVGAPSAITKRIDAASIRVMNPAAGSVPAALPEVVAYPWHDYPARYFNAKALLSFSVIADKSTAFGGNSEVDFSSAQVTIQPRGGAPLAVSSVQADNDGIGLPNNFQFAAEGLQPNLYYDVTIAGARVSGVAKDYHYWFRIVP